MRKGKEKGRGTGRGIGGKEENSKDPHRLPQKKKKKEQGIDCKRGFLEELL